MQQSLDRSKHAVADREPSRRVSQFCMQNHTTICVQLNGCVQTAFTHRIKDSHRYTHTVTNHTNTNTHTHPLPTHRPHPSLPTHPPTHQYMQYSMVGIMHLEYALLGSATRLIKRITCQPGIPLSFSYSELTALISRSTASALNSGLMKNCEKRSRASSNFSLLTEK